MCSSIPHDLSLELRSVLKSMRMCCSIGNLSSVGNPAPVVLYKRRKLTRFVVVVEETAAMQRRESWVFLRTALRKWLVHDLPPNTEVGLVLCNETAANRLHLLTPLDSHNTRDFLAATIPYNPGDSPAASCLYCGLREALDVRISYDCSLLLKTVATNISAYTIKICRISTIQNL